MTLDQATTTDGRRIVAERMAEAAANFLAALDAAQRAKAGLAFEDEQRDEWFYTPTWQAGLELARMSPGQQALAHKLVASGLSLPAYATATTIMGLENVLGHLEREEGGFLMDALGWERVRDPNMYFLAVFGEPGSDRWGWRFGGHHVSVNYTVADGQVVSPTPTFFGSNPAEVPASGAGVLRPLAREEDLARELLMALDEGQRAAAVIGPEAPEDLIQSNRRRIEDGVMPLPTNQIMRGNFRQDTADRFNARLQRWLERQPESTRQALPYRAANPAGIAGAKLSSGQRDLLAALVRQYIDRLPDEIAALEAPRFEQASLEALHFAWAGGLKHREGHYYRIQGPRFLIEYDNVQNDANHIHSVWRDPENDFGRDILARHHAAAH